MNIEQLQKTCRSQKERQNANEKIWTDLRDSQKEFGVCYYPVRKGLAMLGIGKPRCPCCNKKLNKEVISYNRIYEDSILYCDCGYKFAETWRE